MPTLRGIVADFGLAWRLLTVIPLPLLPEAIDRPAGQAAAYFPLVGLILGLLLAAAGRLFSLLLPQEVAAGLVLTLWVGLTGMLHLDGFMDSCDGLLPPRDPSRRLEIMKDSRVGAFGVVGAILLLLLKFSSLSALPSHQAGLVAVPVLARWAITWVMARYPLARAEGLSVFFWPGAGLATGRRRFTHRYSGYSKLVWQVGYRIARGYLANIYPDSPLCHSSDWWPDR